MTVCIKESDYKDKDEDSFSDDKNKDGYYNII